MKLPRRKFLHLAAGAAAFPTMSRVAWTQAYPSRPIRLMIPFPPGGSFDAIGRPWADKMKSDAGPPVFLPYCRRPQPHRVRFGSEADIRFGSVHVRL